MAPTRDLGVKIRDNITLVPVRSYRKFKAGPLSVDFPHFLFDLAREDASEQDIWAVVGQRRDVPKLLAEKAAYERREEAASKESRSHDRESLFAATPQATPAHGALALTEAA
ncbi:unnamed protein product, partial [Prorocentrum cordatum]